MKFQCCCYLRYLLPIALPASLLILACAALVGCKSLEGEFSDNPPPPRVPEAPAAVQTGGGASPSSPIRAGDTLELYVEEDATFNGAYRVREQGDIIIRPVGRIPVAGMSVSQAESRIRAKLQESQLRQATVSLDRVGRAREDPPPAAASSASLRIFMTGQVARPGQHRVPVPESGHLGVYEAILLAGGLSSFPDLRKVHLLRSDAEGKRHRIPVDVEKIERGQIADPPIGDGDVVVVPEKIFGF